MKLLLRSMLVVSIAIVGINVTIWAKSSKVAKEGLAEWSILTYIQSDNSLTGFDTYNVNDMQKGVMSTVGSNVLVQWDQAKNNTTWRYRIVPGGVVESGSFNTDMGYSPENELVGAVQWMVSNYPAKQYALILWNHGSGIEDLRCLLAKMPGMPKDMPKTIYSWIEIPGAPEVKKFSMERGILYDDSQGTLLTNQALASALTRMKTIIGKNLDILGMDACLMAMLEVAYQVKDSVNYFVGSQQTEPGEGWPYSAFLKPLTSSPSEITPIVLSQKMVSAYKTFYTGKKDAADFTLSAINVASVSAIKQNIDQFLANITSCQSLDARTTRSIVLAARSVSIELYMPEYIDLYSFYSGLLNQIQRVSRKEPKSGKILAKIDNIDRAKITVAYKNSLNTLQATLLDGMQKIVAAVVQNAAGPQLANVKGLSIYYPRYGSIHASYPPTLFAQGTSWVRFIQTYR